MLTAPQGLVRKPTPPSSCALFASQRERDDESQLMHFRARSYDPRLGRFVQREPILKRRSRDSYIYARNQPTSLTDPTGEEVRVIGDGVAIQKFATYLEKATGVDVEERIPLGGQNGVRLLFARDAVPTGRRQRALLEALREPFQSNYHSITLRIVDNDGLEIDSFDTRTLDIGDIIAIHELDNRLEIPPSLPTTSAAQWLVHVISENWDGRTDVRGPYSGTLTPFARGHSGGIREENRYRVSLGLPLVRVDINEHVTGDPAAEGGPYELVIPYDRISKRPPHVVGTLWEAYKFSGGRPLSRVMLREERNESDKPIYRVVKN